MQNYQYNKCLIHPQQLLQMVCLQCTQNCLVCPLCMDLHHEKHDMISLKKFMSQQVQKLYDYKPDQQKFIQKIQYLSQSYNNNIEKMRKQIGNQINLLEIFFAEESERFESEMKFICGNYHSKNLHQNIIATKKRIKFKAKLPFEEDLERKASKLNFQMGLAIDDAIRQIILIIEGIKEFYESSNDILLDSKNLNRFQFSQEYKHESIEISDHKNIINKKFDNSYHTSVIVPSLTPFRNQITLKVKKSEHKCVWFGISDLSVIQNSHFNNSYKEKGSNYWLWQAGCDEEGQFYSENSQSRPFVGWNFDEGDRITVRLHFYANGSKQVEFIKNYEKGEQVQDVCSFKAWVNSDIHKYYVCVGLGDEGQSIKIID